jgi:hypothetical protein
MLKIRKLTANIEQSNIGTIEQTNIRIKNYELITQ